MSNDVSEVQNITNLKIGINAGDNKQATYIVKSQKSLELEQKSARIQLSSQIFSFHWEQKKFHSLGLASYAFNLVKFSLFNVKIQIGKKKVPKIYVASCQNFRLPKVPQIDISMPFCSENSKEFLEYLFCWGPNTDIKTSKY